MFNSTNNKDPKTRKTKLFVGTNKCDKTNKS